MSNRKSIIRQVQEQLQSLAAFGQSKFADKLSNGGKPDKAKIYSYKTFENYLAKCCQYARWAREEHGCRTLEEARQYTGQYLSLRTEQDKSAWTVRLDAAALAKLYQCATYELGAQLPSRNRSDVHQHREGKERGHYSYERNRDTTDWGRGTGMRRSEMLTVRPDQVVTAQDGSVWIRDCRGKGGRVRDIPVDPQYALRVREIAQEARDAGRDRVFERVNKYIPEHTFRAEYAQRYYDRIARPENELDRDRTFVMDNGHERSEVYECRRDRAGTHYDARAMEEVSLALGHSRLDVVTAYIR